MSSASSLAHLHYMRVSLCEGMANKLGGDVENGENANPVTPIAPIEPILQPSRRELSLLIVDATFDDKPPVLQRRIFIEDDVERELNSLPPHHPGTARIYDYVHKLTDPQAEQLRVHLEKEYPKVDWHRYSLSPTGGIDYDLDGIRTQWDSRSVMWAKAQGYLWRSTYDGIEFEKKSAYLSCLTIETDRLAVLHKASPQGTKWLELERDFSMSNIFLAESLLTDRSSTSLSDGTRTHYTKLLLLDFLQKSLNWWTDTLQDMLAGTYRDKDDWPLKYGQPPTSEFVERYLEQFLDNERIQEDARDLQDAIDYVLLSLNACSEKSAPLSQRLQQRIVDIRAKCAQLSKLVSRVRERRDRRYDLFVNSLNIHESISVKRLTILAAFFLPLSLASGILSMQTRFVDLHLLLYDFLGVFCLVASIAILVYFILTAALRISKMEKWQRNERYAPWKVRWWSSEADNDEAEYAMVLFSKYILYFCIWAIITASFIVGMVVHVTLGLKVLGYGLAALMGTIVILFTFMCCVILAD